MSSDGSVRCSTCRSSSYCPRTGSRRTVRRSSACFPERRRLAPRRDFVQAWTMAMCSACKAENPVGARFCNSCGVSLIAPASERRKLVTLLFCDMTGSTAMGERTDPEAVRALLVRYFDRIRGIVERHGGTVEKFIGDAVMAVFGVPVAHEDDALRACRAALEMRDALPELGIRGRIGVNTGEVVASTGELLATGDAVNVAARLEQTARPGEVLIGELTYALARDASVESVEPLVLKGKSEPVAAYRLLG